jgi:hypothetical protein
MIIYCKKLYFFKPIKSKSSACFVEDGTIELTTTTESEGNVLHTAVTKINLPDFEFIYSVNSNPNKKSKI